MNPLDNFFNNTILSHELDRYNKLKNLSSVSTSPLKIPITIPSYGLKPKTNNLSSAFRPIDYKPIEIKPIQVEYMERPINPLFVRITDNLLLKETQPLDPMYFSSSSTRKTTIETKFDNVYSSRPQIGYSTIGNNSSIGSKTNDSINNNSRFYSER